MYLYISSPEEIHAFAVAASSAMQRTSVVRKPCYSGDKTEGYCPYVNSTLPIALRTDYRGVVLVCVERIVGGIQRSGL